MITNVGTKIDSIIISCGFNQIISDPTHVPANFHSCIDIMSRN